MDTQGADLLGLRASDTATPRTRMIAGQRSQVSDSCRTQDIMSAATLSH